MSKREVKYPKIGATLFTKDSKEGPLTINKAKELIGWFTEADASAEAGEDVTFGKDFVLRDLEGNKVQLLNNLTNRPFRMTLAKRYMLEVLRSTWEFNGEPIIIDLRNFVQDGQHRLVGFILAEQQRKKDPDHWQQYGIRGPVKIETIVNTGISDKAKVVDTIDTGQKRSLSDVLFRNSVDYGKEFSEAEVKRLASILGIAARLCWLRMGGRSVSDAPHFPHSEALEFIGMHPELVTSVVFVFNEDKGDKNISTYCSLGYAAALHYLAGTAGTDVYKFDLEGTDAIDYSLWDKADEFWIYFKEAKKGLGTLKTALQRIQSGAMGRDEKVGSIINAINLVFEGKEIKSSKDFKIKKATKDGRQYLTEDPRLGGLDVLVEVEEPEEAPEESEEAPKDPKKAKTSSKASKAPKKAKKALNASWEIEEACYAEAEDGTIWKGKVVDLIPVQKALVTADEDGVTYEVKLSQLSREKPKS